LLLLLQVFLILNSSFKANPVQDEQAVQDPMQALLKTHVMIAMVQAQKMKMHWRH
jgi:hypothetical protein